MCKDHVLWLEQVKTSTKKDGRYEARYIAERDANGKAIYKSVYGYSKAEVREKAGVNRFIKVAPDLAEKRDRSLTNSGFPMRS